MEGVAGVGYGEGQNVHIDDERSWGWIYFCCCCCSCCSCCSGAKRCGHGPPRGSRWVDISRIVVHVLLGAGKPSLDLRLLIPDPSTCTLRPHTRTLQPRLDVEERHSRGCAGRKHRESALDERRPDPAPRGVGPDPSCQVREFAGTMRSPACGPSLVDLHSSLDAIRSGLRTNAPV